MTQKKCDLLLALIATLRVNIALILQSEKLSSRLTFNPSHPAGVYFCGEELPFVQGKEQWLRFAGAAVKRYPMPKVRETQVIQ